MLRHQRCCKTPLYRPLAGKFKAEDVPPQRLEISIDGTLELAAHPAQGLDDFGIQSANGGSRRDYVVARKSPRPYRSGPQRKKREVHVALAPILQRDQRVVDPGPGIKAERKPPEGLRDCGKHSIVRVVLRLRQRTVVG